MRLLITGAGGQLGRDLAMYCRELGDEVVAPAQGELDIADPHAVRDSVHDAAPDVIVNAAALTAVDACESDVDTAMLINGQAVSHLRQAAEAGNAHLVQISTDYVFDGTSPRPYEVDDVPNPQSAYGRSKLLGEQLAGPAASVVRTSWLYSRHDANIVATICRLLAGTAPLHFVDDQIGHPTCTTSLAIAIRNIADARLAGLWHCTNAGPVSWFEFARCVARATGADDGRVLPIATRDLDPPRPAPRPANSVLSNRRYEQFFAPLPDFRIGLDDIVEVHRARVSAI